MSISLTMVWRCFDTTYRHNECSCCFCCLSFHHPNASCHCSRFYFSFLFDTMHSQKRKTRCQTDSLQYRICNFYLENTHSSMVLNESTLSTMNVFYFSLTLCVFLFECFVVFTAFKRVTNIDCISIERIAEKHLNKHTHTYYSKFNRQTNFRDEKW